MAAHSPRLPSRIDPGIGSRTTREALVLASSFSESRDPPFGMML
jgi:hypothetical protein